MNALPTGERQLEPWMLRVLGVHGDVVGAGTLIAPDRMLTCAHVVLAACELSGGIAPDRRVDVDFVDMPGRSRVTARVLPDAWVPPDADGRGDVAVLAVDTQRSSRPAAPLRRWPLSGGLDQVSAYGFSGDGVSGGWLIASLIGQGGPGGEWMQLEREAGRPIRPGFSGAAVIDDRRGHVIGMVVGTDRGPSSAVSWMIPVETILAHLPGLEGVTGAPAMDPSLLEDPGWPPADRAVARDIAGTIGDDSGHKVRIVVVTGPAGAAALRDVLRSVDREAGRTAKPEGLGPGDPAPATGSVDLAVDASGKTPGDVLRRIADRAGLDTVDLRILIRLLPPMTIVIGWVDAAADPGGLLAHVVEPLVSARDDLRFVLVFASEQSASMAPARSLRERSSGRDGSAPQRADERVRALIETERDVAHRHSAARRLLAGVPAFPRNGGDLRRQLSSVQADARAGLPTAARAAEQVATLADTARQAAEILDEEITRLLDDYQGARRRLGSDRALAAAKGWAEVPELMEAYRDARAALSQPCDVDKAAEAVRRHAAVLRRMLDREIP